MADDSNDSSDHAAAREVLTEPELYLLRKAHSMLVDLATRQANETHANLVRMIARDIERVTSLLERRRATPAWEKTRAP